MSRPKRHHYVPRAYLARFGQAGKVAVRRRGSAGLIVTNPVNVALETGFYETTDSAGNTSVAIEEWLSDEVDGRGASTIDQILVTNELPQIGDEIRRFLATYIAIQLTRTADRREEAMFPAAVHTWLGDRTLTKDLMAEFLTAKHLGFKPETSEVEGAFAFAGYLIGQDQVPTKTDAIQLSFRLMDKVAGILLRMHWRLEIARKPRFITSDSPVVLWSPPSAKDLYQGYGLNSCEEVRFVLGPGHQIVLTRHPGPNRVAVEPDRVRACNSDLAAACHKFIVGHPNRTRNLTQVYLADRKPTLRFNLGPGHRGRLDGSVEDLGAVMHVWVPRRATERRR